MCYKDFVRRTIVALKGSDPTPAMKAQRKGRINEPLLYIPLNNVVPDELHLLLRTTDILTRNIINAALQYDIQNSRSVRDVLNRPMITNLLKAIRSCGVSFNIYIKKDGFDFTSLVGNDKKKLLNKLQSKFCTCQPPAYSQIVKQIWEVCRYIAIVHL